MTTWHPFNINETVRFKPTEYGHKCHRQEHDEFWASVGKPSLYGYVPMKVDAEGYCEMQMWVFMEKFGQYVGLGREVPFDTNIYFKGDEPTMSAETNDTPDQYAQKPTSWYFDPPEETLRDKIAMAALPAVMQELIAMEVFDQTNDELAKRCYAVADAFMKVRGQ